MTDKITVERFCFDDNPVKDLSVYKDNGRWYARVVLERTVAGGTVERFVLPRVMIPPVHGIISEHTEGRSYFDKNYYYRLELKNNEFVLTEGYDEEIGTPVAFYVRERKYITREKAEEMLSAYGTTYIIVDEGDNEI